MSAEVKSMKEWALYYAELGLAVFPLAYRNKVPAIEGGCKAATTEKSKIERWWNQNPRYNIGIATGNKSNGLVVIDLDVDKNKGIDGYLAKGAVIPPRSEFLAVLGDQKQGNNIETPEALLRKIVREETAGRQAGGGSYRFTAQINRRTLFDEMMKEAQMRRDTSGRNPFEMA